jgi:hypothetical protein
LASQAWSASSWQLLRRTRSRQVSGAIFGRCRNPRTGPGTRICSCKSRDNGRASAAAVGRRHLRERVDGWPWRLSFPTGCHARSGCAPIRRLFRRVRCAVELRR